MKCQDGSRHHRGALFLKVRASDWNAGSLQPLWIPTSGPTSEASWQLISRFVIALLSPTRGHAGGIQISKTFRLKACLAGPGLVVLVQSEPYGSKHIITAHLWGPIA